MTAKTLSPQFLSDEVQKSGWIDIHTHLNFLDISPEQAIADGKRLGLRHFVTIGTEPEDWPVVLDLAQRFPEVYCTLGTHPHEGKVYSSQWESFLRQNLSNPRVIAVGEIGLDYYYNNSSRDEQLEAFRRQMSLAEEFQLPVEIHTRDAEDDTIAILREYRDRVRGVIHCFTGSQRLADEALAAGYNLSFSGIVTFKKAEDLQAVCRQTPLDRMHVETDAPFLAPTPLRGQKNRPEFMLWTAQFVAEMKGVPIPDFCVQMRENARRLFPRLGWSSVS